MSASVWDADDIAGIPSPNQLQIPQETYTTNQRSSSWDAPPSRESASSNVPLQRDVRPSDVHANLDQVPTTNSISPSSFFQRFKIPIFIVLGVLAAAGVAAGVAVPKLLATTNNESLSSSSTDTTTIGGSVTTGASTTSTLGSTSVSTSPTTSGSTSASTSVSTSPTTSGSTSVSTSPTTSGLTSTSPSTASTSPSTSSSSPSTASTTPSTSSSSPSTASTSSSSSSTVSTTSTTVATTTAPLVDPCVNGIYWNITRKSVAGTGSSGIFLNQTSSPTGIYLDSNDILYIADSGNYRLLKMSLNSTIGVIIVGATNISGTNLSLLSTSIRYLYIDSSQTIYVADTYNNRVLSFANYSAFGVVVAGNSSFGSSLNQIYYPYGVWVDSNSSVYVTEYQNHRVTKWPPGATSGILLAGITSSSGFSSDRLSSPAGLYYDEDNNDLYISNSGNASTVMKWRVGALNGTVIAGMPATSGNSSNLLRSPMGITLDQWMNLYVADRSNNRIQLFCNGSLTGITIAGSGTGGSTMSAPYDVKLDSRMNLYVSENSAARVSRFVKI